MKFLRVVLLIAVLLAAICVAAFLCLVMFFDPNKLKSTIEKEVMKE